MSTPDVPSPIEPERRPSRPPARPRTVAEIVAPTLVDLFVAGGLLYCLATRVFVEPWLQFIALLVLAAVAGVRVADIVNAGKGLPPNGGPAAMVLASLASLFSRSNGGS